MCYANPNQTKNKVKVDRPKETFKYGIEVPKSWSSFIRIDGAAQNTSWQDAVKKEMRTLFFTSALISSCLTKNFQRNINFVG